MRPHAAGNQLYNTKARSACVHQAPHGRTASQRQIGQSKEAQRIYEAAERTSKRGAPKSTKLVETKAITVPLLLGARLKQRRQAFDQGA